MVVGKWLSSDELDEEVVVGKRLLVSSEDDEGTDAEVVCWPWSAASASTWEGVTVTMVSLSGMGPGVMVTSEGDSDPSSSAINIRVNHHQVHFPKIEETYGIGMWGSIVRACIVACSLRWWMVGGCNGGEGSGRWSFGRRRRCGKAWLEGWRSRSCRSFPPRSRLPLPALPPSHQFQAQRLDWWLVVGARP